MKSIIVVLLFGVASLSAQTSVGLLGGISYRGNDYTRYDFNYSPISWNDGLTLGIQGETALTNRLSLRASIEYSHYAFDHFRYLGAAPPEYRLGTSRGDDSHTYRIMLEGSYAIRLSQFFTPIVFTGIGYAEERNGQIWYTLVDDINNQQIQGHTPSRFRAFLFHSIGVGFQSYFTSDLGVEVVAKNLSNYNDRFHQSINLGLIYRLK